MSKERIKDVLKYLIKVNQGEEIDEFEVAIENIFIEQLEFVAHGEI